ncbi:DUF3597 domain-containing protein [Roseomonas xinghualingensis]|uniref:DUF3597 domain-containing protein n=1 Tax=Roseomonas xinghualingensis TaxID=2986475 RepID=UPI0021F0CDDE|nr:DUF3597 domain-containing protein [Roseomonas sp. SXEYE001]MCV4207232.1 DUF3597 domain-containing protein [Roseomonas sp. SXEYE001]
MSIFRSIMSKIFNHPAAAAPAPDAGTATGEATPAGGAPLSPTPEGAALTTASAPAATPTTPAAGQAPAAPSAASPAVQVDVQAVLVEMASKSPQKLNWQQSIVDLMKLLDLDSSLAARKELAGELGYAGSTDDSAAMNIWLHKQVMQKLAENGGRVPDSLKG